MCRPTAYRDANRISNDTSARCARSRGETILNYELRLDYDAKVSRNVISEPKGDEILNIPCTKGSLNLGTWGLPVTLWDLGVCRYGILL